MTFIILLFIYILRKFINFNIQKIEINDNLSDEKSGFCVINKKSLFV